MMLVASFGKEKKLIPKTEKDLDKYIERLVEFNQEAMQETLEIRTKRKEINEQGGEPLDIYEVESFIKVPAKGVGGCNLPIQAQGEANSKIEEKLRVNNNNIEVIKGKEMPSLPIKIIGRFVGYFASKLETSLDDARIFIANPDPALLRGIFNLADISSAKVIMKMVLLDKIKHNIKFHLSPDILERHLTKSIKNSLLTPKFLKLAVKEAREGGKAQPDDLVLDYDDLIDPGLLGKKKSFDSSNIMVRLLCNQNISLIAKKLKSLKAVAKKGSKNGKKGAEKSEDKVQGSTTPGNKDGRNFVFGSNREEREDVMSDKSVQDPREDNEDNIQNIDENIEENLRSNSKEFQLRHDKENSIQTVNKDYLDPKVSSNNYLKTSLIHSTQKKFE